MHSAPPFKTTGGRRAERTPFDAKVHFRVGNRRADVHVRDISELGARISGVFLVHEGDQFFLKIGTLEALAARVVWAKDFEFGCEFTRPLNPAIFAAITSGRI